MGYYLSKLPYSQHQLSSNSLHERPLQHIQFSRDTHRPISDGGYSDLVANVDLYSRLAVLEKDLRDAQAENANQEAVIHYLLNAKVHRVGLGSKDLDLVILNLEEKINLVTEDSKQLKVKFQGLLNNTAVPVLDATSRPGDSTSTGSSSCCKRSESEKSQSEDLIDLLDSSKGPETDLIDEDDASLSDNDGDDASYEEDGFPKATPDMSSSEPLQSAFPESNYIHHFVDGDSGSHDLKKGDEIVTKVFIRSLLFSQSLRKFAHRSMSMGPGSPEMLHVFSRISRSMNFRRAIKDLLLDIFHHPPVLPFPLRRLSPMLPVEKPIFLLHLMIFLDTVTRNSRPMQRNYGTK